jgi:NAD(P)-dependent dehydrogenase (short-subunit alcohol dehydrogenase family)
MGKVLIQVADTEGRLLHSGPPAEPAAAAEPAVEPAAAAEPAADETVEVKAVFSARPDRSYLITGGLGGFGLALAAWLAGKGAGRLVLSSKRCAPAAAARPAAPHRSARQRLSTLRSGQRPAVRARSAVQRKLCGVIPETMSQSRRLCATPGSDPAPPHTSAPAARRGLRTGEQAKAVRALQRAGAAVEVSTLDVTDAAEAAALVGLAGRDAPLGGVFHLAMYLDDRLLANQARGRGGRGCA